jgi:CubicO group peptidase (beta-lactamase class C family)
VTREGLALACRFEDLLHGGESWSLVVRHRGEVILEHHTFNVVSTTRFDSWSCTKSFTSLAWGILLEERRDVGLDLPVYAHLPEAAPLSDERKRAITLGHLLGMTSGIAGESAGVIATPPATGAGPFEHAYGHAANRYGLEVGQLVAAPGERWDYSDPAYAHLSPLFTAIAGVPLDVFMAERVFGPLGMEGASWSHHGGDGFAGPHPNAHSGLILSALELSRLGQLMLDGGRLGERQIVPEAWIRRATGPGINPAYGLGWWTNRHGAWLSGVPDDAFGAMGYRCQRCYVIPSHELVIARLGSGPADWDEGPLVRRIVEALTEARG